MDLIVQAFVIYLVIRWLSRRMFPEPVAPEPIPSKYTQPHKGYVDKVLLAVDEYLIDPDNVKLPILNPSEYDYIPLGDEMLFAARQVYHTELRIEGMLLITSYALVFQSEAFNWRIPWEAVGKVRVTENTYVIHYRVGYTEEFAFAQANVSFAAIMIVAHRAICGRCSINGSHSLDVLSD